MKLAPWAKFLGAKFLGAKNPGAKTLALVSSLVAGQACAAQALAADGGEGPLAEHVRAANSRFQDVKVAIAEGYSPIPCTSGIDGGAMGVHYVNGDDVKDEVPDLKRPQAVMYEPQPNGKMELVAVEYISSKGPSPVLTVIPGWCASTRPQMRNCASGNLEIPGSMLTHRPGMTAGFSFAPVVPISEATLSEDKAFCKLPIPCRDFATVSACR